MTIPHSSFQRGDGMSCNPQKPFEFTGIPARLLGDIRKMIDVYKKVKVQ